MIHKKTFLKQEVCVKKLLIAEFIFVDSDLYWLNVILCLYESDQAEV